MKIFYVAISILVFLASCLNDEPFKQEFAGYAPVILNDDWETSTPELEKIERNKLDEAYTMLYNDERFLMARSLLVVRNGKLVAEAYPHNASDRDTYANIQSCTKSFTSMMVGVAMQDNKDISLDEKLYSIYPELFDADVRKRDITLKDALTMRAGLEFSNDTHTLQLYQTTTNSAAFVLSFPYNNEPGKVMSYNDGAPQLVSKIIEQKTGKSLAEYAREKLFDPLNITDWKWESAKDGTTFGAFSLYLKPRDFARVGQLLLQNGRWENNQIISPDYIVEATSPYTSQWDKPYGLYFWIDEFNQGFYAHGHGGQMLLVVPSKRLVLLYTAWPYTSGKYFDDASEMFGLIVDSCE
ncbi:MAG TPA: serine hydrolase [Prolixibacteraceae bacterium]|nr:serine hydrolase [Prolixibacteraceae bacterium]